jgi:hypothetical protein
MRQIRTFAVDARAAELSLTLAARSRNSERDCGQHDLIVVNDDARS